MGKGQLPEWYLEAVQMVQQTDGVLRHLELGLLDFMERQRVDWRVRSELERLIAALHGTAGALAMVEVTARRTIGDLTSDRRASRPVFPSPGAGPHP
jgi:hypothetical protein